MKPADFLEQRLHRLREDFDSSFARPWEPARMASNTILCFTVGGHRFAAQLRQLQSIARAGPVVRVPSRSPALLGLTVLRARLMPLYSLMTLLEMPGAAAETCWLAVLRGNRPAALAIDALAGYADPETGSAPAEGAMPRFAEGLVRCRDQVHALLDCAGIFDAITRDPLTSRNEQDQTP